MIVDLLHILYEYIPLSDLFTCRCMCRCSLYIVSYLFKNTRSTPLQWSEYFNLYKVRKLLPNIVEYNNLGHKKYMKDEYWLQNAKKVWICGGLDNISRITLLRCKIAKIDQLTLQVEESWRLVEIMSTIAFPRLHTLIIIMDKFVNKNHEPKPLHWHMPHIKKIVFRFCTQMFPPYLQWFPIEDVKEVHVHNNIEENVKFPIWLFSLICFWPKVRLSDIDAIHLTNIIPDNKICQSIFIDALKASNIKKIFIHPCSTDFACRLLNQCVYLHVYVKKDTMRNSLWLSIKNAYFPRLEEYKYDSFF